jgi:hypothetical protein
LYLDAGPLIVETMQSDFLSQLAQQLKIDKSPACRRAIHRILAMVKVKYESGMYASQTEAEAEFRARVEEALREIQ